MAVTVASRLRRAEGQPKPKQGRRHCIVVPTAARNLKEQVRPACLSAAFAVTVPTWACG